SSAKRLAPCVPMTPVADGSKTCAAPDCDVSLEGKRKGAKFCGDPCRIAAWKGKSPQTVPERIGTDRNGSEDAPDELPARRSRDYSEIEVETALRAAVWTSGDTRKASKLLAEAGHRKVPRGTLKNWIESGGLYADRYAELSTEMRPEINRHLAAAHESLASAYHEAEWETLAAYKDKIPEMRGDQLANAGNKFAIAGAVHADKG